MPPQHANGTGTPIRVLLVEDDAATARACQQALESTGEACVSHARTVSEAFALMNAEPFDVALVDVGLPDGSGLRIVATLAARKPPTPALVMTVLDDAETLRRAIRAGARGYVLKEDEPAGVLALVMAVLDGATPVSARAATRLFEVVRGPEEPAVALTRREADLLRLLSKGLTYDECSRVLGIATGTVQHHVKHLYRKLDVTSKAEATALAYRTGLVDG